MKLFSILVILFIALTLACKEEDPSGPSCRFDSEGITIGYYRGYFNGGVSSGGVDACEYALSGVRPIGNVRDDDFVDKTTGFIFAINMAVNPNLLEGCDSGWIKIYSETPFATGRRYEAVGWTGGLNCFRPSTVGWIEFTQYDEEAQRVSGRFELGVQRQPLNDTFDSMERGEFRQVPLLFDGFFFP